VTLAKGCCPRAAVQELFTAEGAEHAENSMSLCDLGVLGGEGLFDSDWPTT